jgi:hypothetical protein
MIQPLRRRITAVLAMTLAIAAATPSLAHAASTAATPSHPKLTGNLSLTHAGVVELVPLTANPPAPPTPHLTRTFVPTGTDGGTTISDGTMTLGGGTIGNGEAITSGSISGATLTLSGGISDIPVTVASNPIGINEGAFFPGSPGQLTLNEPTGFTLPINYPAPIDTSTTLGGVLNISSGSATLSSGTLNVSPPSTTSGTLTINTNDGITTTPPTLDPNGPITLLTGPTLTSTSGSFPISLNINAVVITPEPTSLALLTLTAPLLLKRRRA